jgi:4-amino-4-deoxy-L-arabinose transferase-like glycosyltransferase
MTAGVLLIYVGLMWIMHPQPLEGDELRYRDDVIRMQHEGFIHAENPRVYNGPGLPMLLYPLVTSGAPEWVMRLHAPLAVAVAALLLFLTARQFMSQSLALGFSLFCSLHPSLLHQGWRLMPEPLAHLFLAVFLWCLTHSIKSGRPWSKWHLGASVALFALAMTRTVWGPVIMVAIILSSVGLLLPKLRSLACTSLLITIGAFLLCVPYLHYTYSKTGKPLLWTSLSGELAYWMTSYEGGENGHWYADDVVFNHPELNARHGPFLREAYKKKQLECDDLMMQEAIRRAKANPPAVLYNWMCNVSRFFFGFPCSLEKERISSLILLIYNGLLLIAFVIGSTLTRLRKDSVPPTLILLAILAFIYAGGTSVLSTQPRYFLGIMPIVALLALAQLSRVEWRGLIAQH